MLEKGWSFRRGGLLLLFVRGVGGGRGRGVLNGICQRFHLSLVVSIIRPILKYAVPSTHNATWSHYNFAVKKCQQYLEISEYDWISSPRIIKTTSLDIKVSRCSTEIGIWFYCNKKFKNMFFFKRFCKHLLIERCTCLVWLIYYKV